MAKNRNKTKSKCQVTGKIRYHDRREATKHLHWMTVHALSPKIPCRVYPCEYCNGWHATSKENQARNTNVGE